MLCMGPHKKQAIALFGVLSPRLPQKLLVTRGKGNEPLLVGGGHCIGRVLAVLVGVSGVTATAAASDTKGSEKVPACTAALACTAACKSSRYCCGITAPISSSMCSCCSRESLCTILDA
jgi:hypothetical protein